MIGRRLLTTDSWEMDVTERETELTASVEALRARVKHLEQENAVLRENAVRQAAKTRKAAGGAR